ncbi:MAG: hypothetical protein NVS3B3_01690 [Aquirhabdus sp.]
MIKKPLTKDQIRTQWRAEGMTARQWATNHGYKYTDVIRVMNGIHKAQYGIGHHIAVALGMKLDPTETAA